MKILAIFILLCVGLLGLLLWQFTGTTPAPSAAPPDVAQSPAHRLVPSSAASADPVSPPDAESPSPSVAEPSDPLPEPPVSSASAESEPTSPSEAVAAPPASAPVKWLDDPAEERAARGRMNELRNVILDDPANEAALNAALRLARERRWPTETCDLLARLVHLRPDDADLRYQLGTQYMLLRQPVEAVPHLRAAARARPDDRETWYNLAVAHQTLGHLTEAREAWSRVIELDPKNPDAYVHRGEVFVDLRDWSAAQEDFARARQIEPRAIDATLNLALAMTKLGQADQARDLLLPLLAENPKHVPLLNRLAETTWSVYQSDPNEKKDLAAKTREYCDRSLALVADQPEIVALRDQARAAE